MFKFFRSTAVCLSYTAVMHAILFLGAILVLAWDERLTEQLLGEQNRRAAEAAAAADELNWTEVGVGVGADGSPYLQQISRGQASRHIRAGLLLVATDEVRGEIFEKSVVLVVRHDENGTLGLVLNKPAPLPRGFSSREEAPRVRSRRSPLHSHTANVGAGGRLLRAIECRLANPLHSADAVNRRCSSPRSA